MVYVKDGKNYYTLEEASEILDERIEKRAKILSWNLVSKINSNSLNKKSARRADFFISIRMYHVIHYLHFLIVRHKY